MKRFIFTLTLCLSFIGSSVAQIIESDVVAEILPHIGDDPEHTLVIFDIDNTLAAPKLEIGTDQWVNYLVKQKMKLGLDIQQAFNAILPIYFKVQFKVAMHPVEKNTPTIIHNLQQDGVSVIALTARSIFVASRTLDQLDAMRVELGIHGHNDELHLNMPIPCIYMNGVVFSGNNDKGMVLIELLNMINFMPSKIIFLDDKMKNIISVQAAAEQCDIEFVGIRYSATDERVANFDAAKAQEQFEILQQLTG